MKRLTSSTAILLTAIAAALASQSSVAAAIPTNFAGTLYYSKITCEVETVKGCGGPTAPPFSPYTFLLAVIAQSEGSSAVAVHDLYMQATTSTLSGSTLEWDYVGITPEYRGITIRHEIKYRITFSSNGLRWSGTKDESFYEEAGNGSKLTSERRDAIEGDRVPSPTSKPATCAVPRVKGRTLISAQNAIVKGGCAVGKVKRVRSKHVKKGRVIAQGVASGRSVAAGTKINLVVSKG